MIDIRLTEQRNALADAIQQFDKFVYYASLDSSLAVPGEVYNVKQGLLEVYQLMYPDDTLRWAV